MQFSLRDPLEHQKSRSSIPAPDFPGSFHHELCSDRQFGPDIEPVRWNQPEQPQA